MREAVRRITSQRLLGTYCGAPVCAHVDMMHGLKQFRDPARLTLVSILALPFVGELGESPLRRKGPGGA